MYLTSNSLPFFPVWSDVRTKSIVDTYASKIKNTTFLTTICGLPISTYFSAVKLNWLMDNVDEVKNAIKDNKCLFGTVDSWLIWVRVLLIQNGETIYLPVPNNLHDMYHRNHILIKSARGFDCGLGRLKHSISRSSSLC